MADKEYTYTGQTNLEVMQSAVNYNKYLYNLVKREIKTADSKKVKILDFGAGIGTYADILKDRGIKVDCVEIDPNGVSVLKKKGYKVYSSTKETKDKYDIVYSFNVLEHVADDVALLKDMKDAIKDDGSIIIYVPAFDSILTQLDMLVEHLRRYRSSNMIYLAVRSNLKIKRLQYCDPIGFVLAYIYKLIGGNGKLNPKTIWIFDRILFPVSQVLEFVTRKFFGKNILAVYKK